MPKQPVAVLDATAADVPAGLETAVHIVSQKKGGVGKSVTASWIAQYLEHTGRTPACYDTDPSNPSFMRVSALHVRGIDLLDDGEISPGRYDHLVSSIAEDQGPVVIDTGSSSFFAFWNYVARNNLFGVLAEFGRRVVVHVPIAPKPDLEDTLLGFSQIAQLSPAESVVVWLNQREHPIELGGKKFHELDVARENEEKLLQVVVCAHQRYPLHRDVVGDMLVAHQTFAERIAGAQVMARYRLQQVRDEVFRQLAEAEI